MISNDDSVSLLAYVDILGYSDLVNKNADIVNKIPDIISECIRLNRGKERYSSKYYPEIHTTGFSDSIIFTIDIVDYNQINNEMEHLLSFCSNLQYRLIKKGILLRGGISLGNHFKTNFENINYFNSKALIDAHSIETSIEFPAIGINKSIVDLIDINIKQKFLIQDNFNNIFINYVSECDTTDKQDILRFINEKQLEYSQKAHVRRKYEWLETLIKWSYSKSINTFNLVI